MNVEQMTEIASDSKNYEELNYGLITNPKNKTHGRSHKREVLSTTETLLLQKKVDKNTIAVIKNLPIETLIMLKIESTVDTFYDYNMLTKKQLDQVLSSTIRDSFWRTVFSDCGSDDKFNMLLREPIYSKWENKESKLLRRKIRRIAGIDRIKNLKTTKTVFPEDRTFTGPSFADYLKEVEYTFYKKKNKEKVLFGQLEKEEKIKVYKAISVEEVENPDCYLTSRLTRGAERVRLQERESKERIRNRRRVKKEIAEKHLEHRKREYREKFGPDAELPDFSAI